MKQHSKGMHKGAHVLLAADHHYTIPALVTMASLLSSYCSQEPITVHFVSDQADAEVERLFRALVHRYPNASVVFHLIDLSCFSPGRPIPYGTGSYMTFARLLCGRFLPAELSRVLYLDTDMLCMRDVGELFRVTDPEHPVAMTHGHYLNRSCPWESCVSFAPCVPGSSCLT